MKSINPRIERLKEMMSLEEKRVALQLQLDEVMERMTTLKDGLFSETDVHPEPKTAGRKAAAGTTERQTTKRGALKDRIMAALEAAGEAGVRVKDLAQAIGTKPVNVHSWFHSSMKRYPAIKKIQGGHYRLQGSLGDRTPASGRKKKGAAAAPKAKAKGKRGQSRRGELSARILTELESAGSQGINVRDLAGKLGANYKNIYIWFATTGKKNSSIKKIGPATYRLTR
jgi:hypothetical protein